MDVSLDMVVADEEWGGKNRVRLRSYDVVGFTGQRGADLMGKTLKVEQKKFVIA
jgi:hypothetical protein